MVKIKTFWPVILFLAFFTLAEADRIAHEAGYELAGFAFHDEEDCGLLNQLTAVPLEIAQFSIPAYADEVVFARLQSSPIFQSVSGFQPRAPPHIFS